MGYPFPLASGRYEVGPAMRRFGQAGGGFPAEQGHFKPDGEFLPTLLAKLDVLRRGAHEAHLIDPALTDEPTLLAALRASFALVASEHPAIVAVDEQGVTLRHLGLRLEGWKELRRVGEGWPHLRAAATEAEAWLKDRQGLRILGDALALAAQEDLAIVRGPESDGQPQSAESFGRPNLAGESQSLGRPAAAGQPESLTDVFEWLHVCLPSNWAPIEKIGRSFVTAHEPVVHSERLRAAAPQIVRAMIHGGPFVRYVWGIHRDGAYCHNPRLHQQPDWRGETGAELVDQAFLRVERQTTYGFPALNRALFTIRYWTVPLARVAADPWQRERLAGALAGMDEAELDYKGLATVRDRLVAYLSELA